MTAITVLVLSCGGLLLVWYILNPIFEGDRIHGAMEENPAGELEDLLLRKEALETDLVNLEADMTAGQISGDEGDAQQQVLRDRIARILTGIRNIERVPSYDDVIEGEVLSLRKNDTGGGMKTVICRECGTVSGQGHRFCAQCGEKLAQETE